MGEKTEKFLITSERWEMVAFKIIINGKIDLKKMRIA